MKYVRNLKISIWQARQFGRTRWFNCQIFLTLVFLFPSILYAENQNVWPREKSGSIYSIDPWQDGTIIGLSGLGIISAYADADHLIRERCPCDPAELNAWDRSAVGNNNDPANHLSDLSVGAALAFPVLLDWTDVGFSPEFAEDMTVYVETLSVSGALVTLAKYTAQRPLPRTYAGERTFIENPRGYRSFYSGHTSTTFAALSAGAMTWGYRHENDVWPWILTGVVGASVGYERVLGGSHFYSDVIVGAAMGTAVGIAIPRWHRQRKLKDQIFAVIPVPGGLVGVWKFKF